MRTGCEGALEIDGKDVAEVPAHVLRTDGVDDGVANQGEELEPANLSRPRVAVHTRAGWVLLEAHRAGARLTQRQGILAKCSDCMGNYRDGRVDCQCPNCPLYAWMPYREKA
jgi:hypothetical protein